jgi:membrane protease YdiL (CAAX protease family)
LAFTYFCQAVRGVPLPAPQYSFTTAIILFVVFFIAALCEELGWSGYAIDPLQDRFGALQASLLLGLVWAILHFIPLLQVQRSLVFIGWWSLYTVAFRVLITWLYNNTGRSVFIASLCHAMFNLAWQLFPINGSYFDPRVTGSITVAVAIAVVIRWGSRTLVRA